MKRSLIGRAVVVTVLVGISLSGCGGGTTTKSSPSPTPARSVTAIPSTKDAQGNFNELSLRLVEVFIKDSLTRKERDEMAREIGAMPEVELYHLVTKREALERFGEAFPNIDVENMPVNPLPASYEIIVREGTDVRAFAHRFWDDARVDNSPGTHDGVQYSVQPDDQ